MNKEMTPATPLPWRMYDEESIVDAHGFTVAEGIRHIEDGRAIVAAVNTIERLARERDEARALAGKLQEDIDTMYDPAIEHLTRERDEARKSLENIKKGFYR